MTKKDYKSYSEISESLDALATELKAAGISNCGRIEHCRLRLTELGRLLQGGPVLRSEREYFSDLFEAAELAGIVGTCAAFGNNVGDRLRRAACGSTSFVDDCNADGRNISFELSVAMQAHRGGAAVDLPLIGDVTINVDGFTIHVECKRPQSLGALKRNMEKGARQGMKRVRGPNDFAVVFVDASAALNSSFLIRRTNLPRESLYRRAHKWCRWFTEPESLRVNGRTDLQHIGILVRYGSLGVARDDIFHCQTWAVFPNSRLGSRAEIPLRSLVRVFDPDYTESSSNLAIF